MRVTDKEIRREARSYARDCNGMIDGYVLQAFADGARWYASRRRWRAASRGSQDYGKIKGLEL